MKIKILYISKKGQIILRYNHFKGNKMMKKYFIFRLKLDTSSIPSTLTFNSCIMLTIKI